MARIQEAARAAAELEDALVALAESIRTTADKQAAYADMMMELKRAEDRLRSRDRHLAAENEAEMARLAAADVRSAKLEEELSRAQEAERDAAGELVAVQEALNREEASLRRTETELRAAQREAAGTQE
jgi:hypothetical protein